MSEIEKLEQRIQEAKEHLEEEVNSVSHLYVGDLVHFIKDAQRLDELIKQKRQLEEEQGK